MFQTKWWLSGITSVVVVAAASGSASASIFAGNQLEVGWTGTAPFGSYGDGGTAHATYTAPMSTPFSTSPYASSTDTYTSVDDTTITINDGGAGFGEEAWFEYTDVNDTLPDFTDMTFTVDTADTNAPSFSLANDLQVETHALAIRFDEIIPGENVTIDVTVPEPASLGVLGLGAAMLLRRRLGAAAGR